MPRNAYLSAVHLLKEMGPGRAEAEVVWKTCVLREKLRLAHSVGRRPLWREARRFGRTASPRPGLGNQLGGARGQGGLLAAECRWVLSRRFEVLRTGRRASSGPWPATSPSTLPSWMWLNGRWRPAATRKKAAGMRRRTRESCCKVCWMLGGLRKARLLLWGRMVSAPVC